jgi:ABC-type sugar transport system substrate-binding protein
MHSTQHRRRRGLRDHGLRALVGMVGLITLTGLTVTSVSMGSAAAVPRATSKMIYVIGYEQDNPFWVLEGDGAAAAGKRFGVTVRYEAPTTASDAGMVSLIDAALATHPYGIAIDYTDKTMQTPVLKALNAGVKVVLYNNNRFEAQSGGATVNTAITSLAFVGQDEHHSGVVLGQGFLPFLPKAGGEVLIINPYAGAYVLTLRQQGVVSVLKPAGYKTSTLIVNGDDPEGTIEAVIGAYLKAHPKIVGIAALGDPAANPAARAIAAANMKKIPVCTFDMETETYQLMTTGGPLKEALDQQPYLQSYYAAQDLAFEMLYGFPPVNVNTGTFVVTQKNVKTVGQLVKEGKD